MTKYGAVYIPTYALVAHLPQWWCSCTFCLPSIQQAAIGSIALDMANERNNEEEIALGRQVRAWDCYHHWCIDCVTESQYCINYT